VTDEIRLAIFSRRSRLEISKSGWFRANSIQLRPERTEGRCGDILSHTVTADPWQISRQ
jgi:hypothetical protein